MYEMRMHVAKGERRGEGERREGEEGTKHTTSSLTSLSLSMIAISDEGIAFIFENKRMCSAAVNSSHRISCY